MRVNPRIQLRLMRKFARDQKYRLTAQEGGGEREKARRVSQMLRESLRAENGVIQVFEDTSDRISPERMAEFMEEIKEITEEPSNV